jgi:hypothetical protein
VSDERPSHRPCPDPADLPADGSADLDRIQIGVLIMKSHRRFSKQAVLDLLEERMKYLEQAHRFHRGQGYAAVEDKPFKSVLAFGQYDALRDLMEDIEGGYL